MRADDFASGRTPTGAALGSLLQRCAAQRSLAVDRRWRPASLSRLNWIYQVVRKPSELLFPVSGTLFKTPAGDVAAVRTGISRIFDGSISPELLAALAQVEGSGNPIVRTYWRWSWRWRPSEVYRPASSAVECIRSPTAPLRRRDTCASTIRVVREGPLERLAFLLVQLAVSAGGAQSCHRDDRGLSGRSGTENSRAASSGRAARLPRAEVLATLIHLCGAGAGEAFAARHFRPLPAQHCGDHDVAAYLARVNSMESVFARLAAQDDQ